MAARYDSGRHKTANLGFAFAKGIAISVRILPLFPIPIGIAMFFITPSYTTQLVGSPIGWLLLAFGIGFSAGGYGVNALAIRLARKGNLPIGVLLVGLSTVFLIFPALWIVFIGPALVIFIQHPS